VPKARVLYIKKSARPRKFYKTGKLIELSLLAGFVPVPVIIMRKKTLEENSKSSQKSIA
jgi:hypothetical protein